MNRAQRREQSRQIRRALSTPAKRKLVADRMRAESAARQIDNELQTDLAILVRGAFVALQTGQASTTDLANIGDAIARVSALAGMGYGAESLPAIETALDAYCACTQRWQQTGRIEATAAEMADMAVLVDLHDQQIHLGVSQGDLHQAIKIARDNTEVVA